MSKAQNIKDDLEAGKIVNMLGTPTSLQRYGSSLRSRIAEFRASGMEIEGRVCDKSGALEYYMIEHITKENGWIEV